jgi:hypothetical protein
MWGRGMGMDIFFERVSRNVTYFVSCHCSDHLIRFSSHVAGMFRMRLIPLVFYPTSVKTPHFVVYGLHLKPAAHITNGKSAVARTRTQPHGTCDSEAVTSPRSVVFGGCNPCCWRVTSTRQIHTHARMVETQPRFHLYSMVGNHKHLRPPGGLPLSFLKSHHFGLSSLASTLMDPVGALGVVVGVV